MSDFTTEGPVLDFGPRHRGRWRAREYLLWPAWAYRVVAPRMQPQLNVLQRAVMGLSHAGVRRAEDIADSLSIHRDLAAFILFELIEIRHLDDDGAPTPRGLKRLDEDTAELQDLVAGHVFQDPWSGELWPRFVTRLEYCAVEYGERGFPSLLLGPTGAPRRQRAFMVFPRSGGSPSAPSALSIINAVARHRRKQRFSGGDEGMGDPTRFESQIPRVSFIDETPQPVFLLTYLYIPEANSGEMDWYACDPFGFGSNSRLRRAVEVAMRADSRLLDVVDRILGRTVEEGREEHRQRIASIQTRAALEVERRLTINIRAHAAFEQLCAMEAAWGEARLLGRGCPPHKVDECLRAGVKVLEAVFAAVAAKYPLGTVWKRVYIARPGEQEAGDGRLVPLHDRALCAGIFEGAFRTLGFASTPQPFLNVKPGQLRSVATRNDHWRLRPLVTATALLAEGEPAHPLWRAARCMPEMLDAIDQIARLGGAAGHAGGAKVGLEEAEAQISRVYAVVSALLGETGADCESTKEPARGTDGTKS